MNKPKCRNPECVDGKLPIQKQPNGDIDFVDCPACTDGPKLKENGMPECDQCQMQSNGRFWPCDKHRPAQPDSAGEFVKYWKNKKCDVDGQPIMSCFVFLSAVKEINRLHTQLASANQPSIDFNKGWELARQGKPREGLEDDILAGWKVFMYDELEAQYLKLRNEVIDMQSAIIGWRKRLAFNSEDDLIGALEKMIERALKVTSEE